MARLVVFLISAFGLALASGVIQEDYWTPWQPCSKTCGGGTRNRIFICVEVDQVPQNENTTCYEQQVESCNEQPCPIDGDVGDWSDWSSCSVTCGGGTRDRSRACDNPTPDHGGADCSKNLTDSEGCNEQHCPIDGGISEWAEWTECSVSCAGGNRTRSRECNNPVPQYNGSDCVEERTESEGCKPDPCPVDGGVGDWAAWAACSTTCGGGSKLRARPCDNPAPAYGGANCSVDDLSETGNCSENPCPIDGGVGEWMPWSNCTEPCGTGNQTRQRLCDSPTPQYSGADCTEVLDETQNCNTHHCPVHGGAGAWGNWSVCSVTCGGGDKQRERLCDNPAPAYGGNNCSVDDLSETAACNVNPCPVDGGVGEWGAWSNCSVECGGGTSDRVRSCDNPSPAHGGSNCREVLTQSQDCNEHHCPIDGGVSDWGNWSECSTTCGDGVHVRTRTCDNPLPQYNGTDCEEPLEDSKSCSNTSVCPPVDGGIGQWTDWVPCSVTCGGGKQTRSRSCDSPAPEHNGTDCSESLSAERVCNNIECGDADGVRDSAGSLATSLVTLLGLAILAVCT